MASPLTLVFTPGGQHGGKAMRDIATNIAGRVHGDSHAGFMN